MQHLHELTNKLIFELEHLKEIFYQPNDPEVDKHVFFHFVKEQTTPVFNLLKKWEDKALAFVKEEDGRVHPKQIIATKENMELLLLHSYYKDIRKRRFMEYYSSCIYVFNQLKEEIKL